MRLSSCRHDRVEPDIEAAAAAHPANDHRDYLAAGVRGHHRRRDRDAAVGRSEEWYFFDEWRLVVERVVPHPNGPFAEFKLLFKPDGEHVIGIPLTLFVIIVRWFGLDNYWPIIFVNIVVRVATLLVLDDVCRRVGARRLVRLLAVACIAFFGEGYESLFAQSVMFAGFTLIFGLMAIRQSLKTEIAESACRHRQRGVAVGFGSLEQLRLSGCRSGLRCSSC